MSELSELSRDAARRAELEHARDAVEALKTSDRRLPARGLLHG